MTWEMDTFHAPTVVGEKGQRPYCPVLFLLADRDSYFILDVHLSEPGRYPAELHDEFLKAIEKNKIIPKEIRVRKEELQVYLGPLAERLGIRVQLDDTLPSINEAKKGMSQFFKKKGVSSMATKQSSDVEVWLERETDHVRKALENASRHFDSNDNLTVNTLEAVYARESSFGLPKKMGERGSTDPAGHFQLSPDTARRYGLSVTKNNDQRLDIDYTSSASARYLKDLHNFFSKDTALIGTTKTIGVKNPSERKKFVLGAFNAGEGSIAKAQRLAQEAGKNPQLWSDRREKQRSAF